MRAEKIAKQLFRFPCQFTRYACEERSKQDNPDRSAAAVFPTAARANRSVFYERDGSPRSLSEVYQRFADKLGGGSDAAATAKANNQWQFAAQALAMGQDATVVTGALPTIVNAVIDAL